jgi:DNA anti-recombination protein RmuC
MGIVMGGSQPNLSTIETPADVSNSTQITFRNKRKNTNEEYIKEELSEIRKGMAEMMQMLTSINSNQTETIKKLSEDSLKENILEIKNATDKLGCESENIKLNIDSLLCEQIKNNADIERIDSELNLLKATTSSITITAPCGNNTIEETLMT